MRLPAKPNGKVQGIAARFPSIETLREAVRRMAQEGYRQLEAYTPFFDEQLDDALPQRPSRVPLAMLAGGATGGLSIYLLQYWINLYAYPLNIGGRALHSWPAFIPPTFETTVLCASITGLIGMLVACRLPQLHHPMFDIPQFRRASTDGFFLFVAADDPRFDHATTRAMLDSLEATELWDVCA